MNKLLGLVRRCVDDYHMIEEGDRIAPNRTFVQRTVFICMRPNRILDHDWASPWGRNSSDYGLRFWKGPDHWDVGKSADFHFADGSASDGSDAFRKNGEFDIYSTDGESPVRHSSFVTRISAPNASEPDSYS